MKFTADEMQILCANHCGTKSKTFDLVKKIVPEMRPVSSGKEKLADSLLEKLSQIGTNEPVELAFDSE